MWRHLGASRYIWNYMLDLQQSNYENGEKHLSAFDTHKLITLLKQGDEHKWLYEVSNTMLKRTCSDLNEAYTRFFHKTSGMPRFKSRKKSKPSFPINTENFYFKDEKVLNIEKIGKVKYKTDFEFQYGRSVCKYNNTRVSYEQASGKWYVSFGKECENQAHELTDSSMGIDLGVKDLAVVEFNGEQITFHNINKSKRMRSLRKKLKHTQRSISRKYEQNKQGNKFIKTANIEKEEQKLRKIYKKMDGIRKNYLHQTTHKLVSMLPKTVVMEDLNVSGMMKNRHLSKAIAEQGFYEFIRQMRYKCEWYGIEFLQVDRFYPSSKTCSVCGNIKKDLRLSDRTYHCECCGTDIDRDYNAAVNLSRYVA